MKYCLVGEKLSHSYSEIIHKEMGLDYCLQQILQGWLGPFMSMCEYQGFNVTIPYKKEVIKYLVSQDPISKKVGAVNTVVRKEDGFHGYNTDVGGMKYMIERTGVTLKDKNVLILGTGGTSNTAEVLCQTEGAKKITKVSRKGEINYSNCYQDKEVEIIINTTPVGTYPQVEQKPIDLTKFPNLKGVFDCVYNPMNTELIAEAKRLKIPCSNGLPMLVKQALLAQDIWLNNSHDDSQVERLIKVIKSKTTNIVLSGMASCGKSVIGETLAKLTGREFFDSDVEIEKIYGKTPAEIITQEGEQSFREKESEVIKDLAKNSGVIISLGGGGILREENVHAIKRNGFIFYVERDLSLLVDEGRPLSQKKGIENLYNERKELYQTTSDQIIKNDRDITEVAKEIIEKYESACN